MSTVWRRRVHSAALNFGAARERHTPNGEPRRAFRNVGVHEAGARVLENCNRRCRTRPDSVADRELRTLRRFDHNAVQPRTVVRRSGNRATRPRCGTDDHTRGPGQAGWAVYRPGPQRGRDLPRHHRRAGDASGRDVRLGGRAPHRPHHAGRARADARRGRHHRCRCRRGRRATRPRVVPQLSRGRTPLRLHHHRLGQSRRPHRPR